MARAHVEACLAAWFMCVPRASSVRGMTTAYDHGPTYVVRLMSCARNCRQLFGPLQEAGHVGLCAMMQVCMHTTRGGVGVPLPAEERAAATVMVTHQTHAARAQGLSEACDRPWGGRAQEEAAEQARAALLADGTQVRDGKSALGVAVNEEYPARRGPNTRRPKT